MASESSENLDLRTGWAADRILADSGTDGDPLAAWCSHVERNGFSVSSADWVALQILQGDDSHWQTASRDSDVDVRRAQWQLLRAFADAFFQLSAADKQRQFRSLRAHLQGNTIALQQLDRYEPFLDLNADGTEGEEPDVAELMRSLLQHQLGGPLERKQLTGKLFTLLKHEPLRWRTAASRLQQHPCFSGLAPLLLDQLARIDPHQDSPRQIAKRQAFGRRHATRFARHRLKGMTAKFAPAVPILLLILPGILAIAVRLMRHHASPWNSPSTSWRTATTSESSRSQSLKGMQDDSVMVAALAKMLEQQEAFNYLEKQKQKWEETAREHGSEGLSDTECQLSASSEKGADQALQYFKWWRIEYGNSLAQTADQQAEPETNASEASAPEASALETDSVEADASAADDFSSAPDQNLDERADHE